MNIVQIRASIFYPQTIGFTPENASKYRAMFLPNGNVAPASPFPEMAVGNLPLGMPWQLVGRDDYGNSIVIVFLPNKIDIVKNIEQSNEKTENDFVSFCSEKFKLFLDDVKMNAVRLAYSPLLAMADNDAERRMFAWQHLIKQTSIEGVPCQDVNVSFLTKKIKQLGDKDVDTNFLFKMMDGMKLKDGIKTADSILIQLDINTVPEASYSFSGNDVEAFLSKAIEWKNEYINSVLV